VGFVRSLCAAASLGELEVDSRVALTRLLLGIPGEPNRASERL